MKARRVRRRSGRECERGLRRKRRKRSIGRRNGRRKREVVEEAEEKRDGTHREKKKHIQREKNTKIKINTLTNIQKQEGKIQRNIYTPIQTHT